MSDPRALAELEPPPVEEPLFYLWDIFAELAAARGGNGFGMNPLGWHDIEAWQRLTGCCLSAWERGTLLELDRVYLMDAAEQAKRRRKAEAPAR